MKTKSKTNSSQKAPVQKVPVGHLVPDPVSDTVPAPVFNAAAAPVPRAVAAGVVQERGVIPNTKLAFTQFATRWRGTRVVMECGAQSPWISDHLREADQGLEAMESAWTCKPT